MHGENLKLRSGEFKLIPEMFDVISQHSRPRCTSSPSCPNILLTKSRNFRLLNWTAVRQSV